VFAYAQSHGSEQVDKAMTRLLALAEYKEFCEMMHRYAEEEELSGSMGVMGMCTASVGIDTDATEATR